MIGFLCGPEQTGPEDEYCAICRQAGRDIDCKTCAKTFNVINPEGK